MQLLIGHNQVSGSRQLDLLRGDGIGWVEKKNQFPGKPVDLSAHDIVSGISAAICGRPVWKDNSLARIAMDRSPSHALLTAYETHSSSCLDYIGGAFSLAVIDPTQNRTMLAVDRFGIGQMYWTQEPDQSLFFGSSLSCLLAHIPRQPELNWQSVYDYLYFHFVPSPQTIWEEIQKLEPAHCLIVENSNPRISTYWQPHYDDRQVKYRDLKCKLFDSLSAAVARSEKSENIGAFLSGGLDSSTLCGLLSELSTNTLDAFTVSFDINAYNELPFAKIAAKHFGLNHHVVEATADETADSLDDIFSAYDEPFGNSSVVPTYICAKAAKKAGIETLIAGDGGDELFAGNARYAKQKLFQFYSVIPNFARNSVIEPLVCGLFSDIDSMPIRKLRRYVEQARIPMPRRLESYNYLEMWPIGRIFRNSMLEKVHTNFPLKLLERRYNEPARAEMLDRMLYLDWKFTLADNDLRKVTMMCALAGVEVEFPFLDDQVVEMSTRVPSSMKLRGTQLRHFYTKAMRGYLPEEILNKPKHGFGLPFGDWLGTSPRLQEIIYSCLSDLKKRDIVRPGFLDNMILEHQRGHAVFFGEAVWIFSALEMWFKKNMD